MNKTQDYLRQLLILEIENNREKITKCIIDLKSLNNMTTEELTSKIHVLENKN